MIESTEQLADHAWCEWRGPERVIPTSVQIAFDSYKQKVDDVNISDAIDQRLVIEFDYDGHPRTVIPAAYGNHATTGNLVLRGYQIGGTGNSRAVPFWDLFLVSKIAGLNVTTTSFTEDPPMFSRGDKHISPLLAEL